MTPLTGTLDAVSSACPGRSIAKTDHRGSAPKGSGPFSFRLPRAVLRLTIFAGTSRLRGAETLNAKPVVAINTGSRCIGRPSSRAMRFLVDVKRHST